MSENKNRISLDAILPKIATPVKYTPEYIGFESIGESGKGVKICVIDSGLPNHSAIVNIGDAINFSNSDNARDMIGHSSLISGLLVANNPPDIVGIVPDAKVYYAKMIDDKCRVKFDAFVAAILWAVIKKVDIIVIPMSTDIDSQALKDAIGKANDSGICVVASSGHGDKEAFPAKYPNVLSVGSLDKNHKLAKYSAKGDINLVGDTLQSTYIEQTYAVVSGTSVSTALAAGLCARAIEKFKVEKVKYTTQMVFDLVKTSCQIKE